MIENLQDEFYPLENKQAKGAKLGANNKQEVKGKNAPKLSSKYLVHGIGAKIVSNWEQHMLHNESQQIFCRKKMSMLTSLKVSSLACTCIFYRPEHNSKRERSPQNQILKVLKCRNGIYQRIELKEQMEKNGVLCLVIMFTPRVMVIKISKMAHFFLFSADASKKSVTVWKKYLRVSERSYLALSENAMDYCILSYHQQVINP